MNAHRFQSVQIAKRITQRVFNLLLLGFAFLVMVVAAYSSVSNAAPDGVDFYILIFYLIPVLVLGVVVFVALKYSTTVGGLPLSITYLSTKTGKPAGLRVLVKFLLQTVFEVATAGLGMFSYLIGYRDGQHWIDRIMKVVAVEPSFQEWTGRDE